MTAPNACGLGGPKASIRIRGVDFHGQPVKTAVLRTILLASPAAGLGGGCNAGAVFLSPQDGSVVVKAGNQVLIMPHRAAQTIVPTPHSQAGPITAVM